MAEPAGAVKQTGASSQDQPEPFDRPPKRLTSRIMSPATLLTPALERVFTNVLKDFVVKLGSPTNLIKTLPCKVPF